MPLPTRRTARFLRTWLRSGRGPIRAEEVTIRVAGEPREATLYLPEGGGRAPGWVVLHGRTVPGRHHEGMMRFVRSLAGSGAAVLVPDVPPWRELRLDVEAARETLADAALHLAERPEVRPGGVGTVGFSFGATQALMAAADPRAQGAIRAVVGFGGYADLGRMLRALFTGEHEWKGERYRMDPDPYGRWIIVGNYITLLPGYEGMTALAKESLALALEAGRRRSWAWEAEYDPLKAEIRARLSPEEQRVWDVIAAPAQVQASRLDDARELAEGFTAAALEHDPGLDPRPHLPALAGTRIVLSHGRTDRLIPFTETLRLETLLPPGAEVSTTITGLFAHSAGAGWLHPVDQVRETMTFVRLLNGALGAV